MALSKERRQITPGEIRMTHFREELREKLGMRTVKSRMGEKIKPLTDSITNAEEKTPVFSAETTSTESASKPTGAEPKKRKSRSATLRTDTGEEAAPVAASEPKPMAQSEPILTSEPQPADFDVVVDGRRLGGVNDGRMFIDRPEQRTDDNVERTIHSGVYFEHVEGGVVNLPPTEPIVINHDHNPNHNNPWIVGLGALVLAGVLGLAGMANSKRDIDAPIVPATATPSGAAGTSRPEATPTSEKIYITPEPTVLPNPSLVVEIPSPTPVASATPKPSEASGTPNPTVEPSTVASNAPEASQVPGTELAVINGDKWVLKNGDGKEMQVSLPDGFTPDARLVMATNIKKGTLNKNLSVYKDWEKALNTGRPVGDRLSGYNYDYNDFCPTADFKCNVQGDMYAWRIFQGMEVNIPGIGELKGGEGRSVMVLFLNSTPDVTAWDNEGLGQVEVKRGFTATGREFDANPYSPKFQEMEPGLLGHWLYRQAQGTPEKSYVGITNSPDNAKSTLYAVVVKNQWGNNPDGTPRYQFQLLDAGIAQFNGTKVSITK